MTQGKKFIGIVGLVALLFGQIVYFAVGRDVLYLFPLHLVVGVLAILLFLFGGGSRALRSPTAKRSATFGMSAAIYSALFFALLFAMNYAAARYPVVHFDATESQVYTLAPETTATLKEIQYPLIMRGFFLNGEIRDPRVRDMVDRLVSSAKNIRFEMYDPEKQPTILEQYGISEKGGTLHFTYEHPSKTRIAKLSGTIDEQEIVNTLKKLIRGEARKVGYLFGHGEPAIQNSGERTANVFLREGVEGENLSLIPLILGRGANVPKDLAAVVIVAPRKPLLPEERDGLQRYLREGGNALILAEPKTTTDLHDLVRPLGIDIVESVILDQDKTLIGSKGLGVEPLITDFQAHPITENFHQSILLTTACVVRPLDSTPPGASISTLAKTGATSWAETNIELLFTKAQAALEATDIQGPVSVAVAYEGKRSSEEGATDAYAGRVVVIGDSDFVNNASINQMFNRDFFLNALNWTVGEEKGVTLRSRTMRNSKKGLSVEEFDYLFAVTAVLLPELLLLLGLYRWWSRRG